MILEVNKKQLEARCVEIITNVNAHNEQAKAKLLEDTVDKYEKRSNRIRKLFHITPIDREKLTKKIHLALLGSYEGYFRITIGNMFIHRAEKMLEVIYSIPDDIVKLTTKEEIELMTAWRT